MSKKETEGKKRDIYSIIIKSLIGVLIALFIIVFFVTVFRFLPATTSLVANTFSAIFGGGENEDTISLRSDRRNINSGEQMTFNIENSEQKDGVFSLQYACIDGLLIKMNRAQGSVDVPCGRKFYLNQFGSSTNLTLSIFSSKQAYVEFPVELHFDGSDSPSEKVGEVFVTVENPSLQTNVSVSPTVTTTPVTPVTTPTTVVTGPILPDLSVRIISIGVIDRFTGIFIPNASVRENDRVGVQFEVINTGNTQSGLWSFNAILPIQPPANIYASPVQSSIPANGRTLFTLGLEGLRNGQNLVMISIDPSGSIQELQKANNTLSFSLSVSGSTGTNTNTNVNNSSALADLSIRLVDIGRMSGNRFISRDYIDVGDDLAIKFVVENIGGRSSGDWRFKATLEGPRNSDDKDYRSARQASLSGGQSTEMILTFENLRERGIYEISIEIDPERNVNESRRGNNILRTDIEVDD